MALTPSSLYGYNLFVILLDFLTTTTITCDPGASPYAHHKPEARLPPLYVFPYNSSSKPVLLKSYFLALAFFCSSCSSLLSSLLLLRTSSLFVLGHFRALRSVVAFSLLLLSAEYLPPTPPPPPDAQPPSVCAVWTVERRRRALI